MAGFYMKCNSGLNWVYFEIRITNTYLKLICHTDGVIRSRNFEKNLWNFISAKAMYTKFSLQITLVEMSRSRLARKLLMMSSSE